MEYTKADLTSFAKQLAFAHHQYLNLMCIAEELAKSELGMELRNESNNKLLEEISKRYAKYVRNECSVDIDNGEVQECQNIINDVVACCEENKWFE